MKSIVLSLNMAEYVKDFVQIVTKYNYDMDLRCGRYVVDAKSILGIFSLDLNSPVVLEIYNNDCDNLIAELSPYILKD
ncbi:MAG: HPr family phosphocarrier protein [Clostridia bacterium]|jgi:phosphocarrier protein HPr|nr:HPr family phosphocarrier protein [Clostridia bacterium]MCX4366910.1 HPr family phosphocarrier protein [Clostridia bacterium]